MSALREHLLHQFRHARHADGQLLDALGSNATGSGPPAHAMRLMGHLLRAQDVWLGRIQNARDLPALWEDDTLADCRARAETSHTAWETFLQGCCGRDLARPVRYANSSGKPLANELREICGHVVNHSTHHRGQIAALLRQAGGAPPVTGYIYWARTPATNPRHPLYLMSRPL